MSVRGFDALEVLTMETWLPCLASQVQPDPKLPTACAEKSSKNLSVEPHLLLMAWSNYPVGSFLSGVIQYQ